MIKKYFLVLCFCLSVMLSGPVAFAKVLHIVGAGATFPYPLYARWAQMYHQKTKVAVNYQPIGSGGGIVQINAGTVDFGATDKPLSVEALHADQLLQFPAVIGAVVPIVNIPHIPENQLILSGPVLADIYLGVIKKWSNPKIAALNPTLSLPDLPITVVHRSDGSGTTFIFANYLSKVSAVWSKQVGGSTALSWPVGIGGKGNAGVDSYVQRISGSIGYVEYVYAKRNYMSCVRMVNAAGRVVSPSPASFKAASSGVHWDSRAEFSEMMTNAEGVHSWPIVGATFILMKRTPNDFDKANAVLHFFRWAYTEGRDVATEMSYVPLPDKLVESVEQYWCVMLESQKGSRMCD